MTNSQIKREITHKINELWEPFKEEHGSLPPVKFDLKGTSAGQLRTRNFINKPIKFIWLRFNLPIAMANQSTFFDRTVAHELGHVLAYKRHGIKGKGHGKHFKRACADLGLQDVETCHNYDVPKSARRPMNVTCTNCDFSADVSRVKHARMQERNYTHGKCKGSVK